ncbi:MAG: uL15 family ribosomal protein, partial [Candidatus Thermoplasmatota archaeon]
MVSRTKKFRGSRTHGRGQKAGRGAGKRGGRGMAGTHKHKYLWVLKYKPDYFGRRGFKRPQKVIKEKKCINLYEIIEKNLA